MLQKDCAMQNIDPDQFWTRELSLELLQGAGKQFSCLTERTTTMIQKLTLVVIFGWLGVVGVAHAASDPAAGKAKAAMCAGCHGEKGEGVAPNPKLAGMSEADLVKALKDFKSGAKSNAMMNGIAATLSDQDMENLAAYYASLK